MHGWGNDFVVFDGPMSLSPVEVTAICDRRFGIGADGVLVVSGGESVTMEYWNADGNPAEMCGNGLRCVARYASDRGLVSAGEFNVVTPVGARSVEVDEEVIRAEIGSPRVVGHTEIDGERYHLIDVGNPHAVVEVGDLDGLAVSEVGARVGTDPQFRDGTNVEFVRFGDGGVDMRVWERGVGETLACGSGMVAAAFVATKVARFDSPVAVTVPGGTGQVDFREGSGWLIGPVSYSFEGVWDLHHG